MTLLPRRKKRTAQPGPADMTAAELREWRKAGGWTQGEAALLLRSSLRAYQQWEDGQATLPAHLPLACMAVNFGLCWRRGGS